MPAAGIGVRALEAGLAGHGVDESCIDLDNETSFGVEGYPHGLFGCFVHKTFCQLKATALGYREKKEE